MKPSIYTFFIVLFSFIACENKEETGQKENAMDKPFVNNAYVMAGSILSAELRKAILDKQVEGKAATDTEKSSGSYNSPAGSPDQEINLSPIVYEWQDGILKQILK